MNDLELVIATMKEAEATLREQIAANVEAMGCTSCWRHRDSPALSWEGAFLAGYLAANRRWIQRHEEKQRLRRWWSRR